jgi:hypothetical protein
MGPQLTSLRGVSRLCRCDTNLLHQEGLEVNAEDVDSRISLHWVARYEDLAIIQTLLAAGARADHDSRTRWTRAAIALLHQLAEAAGLLDVRLANSQSCVSAAGHGLTHKPILLNPVVDILATDRSITPGKRQAYICSGCFAVGSNSIM